MNDVVNTQEANELFNSLKPLARSYLSAVNDLWFVDAEGTLLELRAHLDAKKSDVQNDNDDYRNDLWVLDRYIDLLAKYGNTWRIILDQRFSTSWCALQDSLDLLRLIKKFSRINISFFEDQLIELEKTYPYNIFFSIGATVEFFECSICGEDIDSQECSHIRGQLYAGQMAMAIARNMSQFDHVAMVSHPEDKRCVVSYEDTAEQFKLIRYLSSLIARRDCRISDFGHLRFSKRFFPNPNYRKLPRNEPCFCGSGKKFKYCCIEKTLIEGEHASIVAEPRCIEHAVV